MEKRKAKYLYIKYSDGCNDEFTGVCSRRALTRALNRAKKRYPNENAHFEYCNRTYTIDELVEMHNKGFVL